MKKLIISLSILSVSFSEVLKAQAQTFEPGRTHILDTIYANDKKNVALFFPNPIKQGITGSENFVFTYNRDKEQYFGLLQAKPGDDSNLLVVNKDGAVYSYIIRYKKQVSKLNYFFPQTESIGYERPISNQFDPQDSPSQKSEISDLNYKKFSEFLIARNEKIGRINKNSNKIKLSVKNIVFHRDELYFVIEIENASSLDYDINFLKFYTETKKQGKRKSIQRLEKSPVFILDLPSRVSENEKKKMIFVLPKFSLADGKRLVIELNEQNGERNINLIVKNRFIKNPN